VTVNKSAQGQVIDTFDSLGLTAPNHANQWIFEAAGGSPACQKRRPNDRIPRRWIYRAKPSHGHCATQHDSYAVSGTINLSKIKKFVRRTQDRSITIHWRA
jgi:hypothetical protein